MKEATHILVVDDDPDICIMIKMMLEYHHYKVLTADGDTEARGIFETNEIDLLIMDMLLSGEDGTDICRRLKQEKRTASMPIIMFSAHPNARESCLAAGADQFIAKPFEMSDMLEKINHCLTTKKQVGE